METNIQEIMIDNSLINSGSWLMNVKSEEINVDIQEMKPDN